MLDDVDAVVARLDLTSDGRPPAIVGHSFGGLVAVRWAIRHPGCPALVDLDGHRSAETDEENYPGIERTERTAALTRLRSFFDTVAAQIPERLNALRYHQDFRDGVASFGDVTCPFLVVLSTKDLPGTPPELAGLTAAHRRGLRRDLAPLAERRRNIHLREIDASHAMVAERPDEVADIVLAFVGANRASGDHDERKTDLRRSSIA